MLLAALPLQAVAQTPSVSISVAPDQLGTTYSLTEGETATFTVKRMGDNSEALTVNYSINSGGGPANLAAEQAGEGDYTSNIPTTYEFPAGSLAPHEFMVTAINGDIYEPNEYFTVTASGSYQDDQDMTVEFSENVIVRIKENDERYLTLSPVSDSVLMGVSHPEFKAKEGGTGNENQLKISLNEPLPYALDIRYTVGDDPHTTAAEDKDFTMTSGIATITANQLFTTINIDINDDVLVEPTEYFTLDFSAPTYDNMHNAIGQYNQVSFSDSPDSFSDSNLPSQPLSVSIMDNDTQSTGGVVHLRGEGGGGIPGFPSTRRTLPEGQSVTITAEIAGAATLSDIQIPLKFDHFPTGEATSDDYSIPTSITILKDKRSGSVELIITDDMDDERYRELLVVEIDDATNFPTDYTKGDRSKYEVIMLDNDKTGAKLQGLSPSTGALSEASGKRQATFKVEMDRPPKKDTPSGAPFSVTVAEGDPTFKLNYSGREERATKGVDYTSPDTVPIENCSAADTKWTCTVKLMVIDDQLYERGTNGRKEHVRIDLNHHGSSFNGDGVRRADGYKELNLTIEDDDMQPMFSIENVSGPEDGNLTFTVKREGAKGNDVSVTAETGNLAGDNINHATEVTDYVAKIDTLRFMKTEIRKTFEVSIEDDSIDEPNEQFAVKLRNPVDNESLPEPAIATGTAVGTITDNEDPVSFSIADAEATEGGKVTFTVSRAGAEGNVASVKVATATDSGDGVKAADADDYTVIATAQTLNFAAGDTSQTVEVQTTQDDLFEPDETFKAVLSDPVLGQDDPGTEVSIESGKGTATGTIKNDDTEPSFAVADASASEGDAITFTVTRSGAMDNVVSVKWNTKAANGAGADSTSDYTPATTATKLDFAKGVGTQTFTVATTEDVLHEGDETFLVELTEPVGGTITDAEATGTITDDDTAPSGITLSVDTNGSTSGTPSTVAEDAGATVVTVTATVNGTTRYVDAKTVAVSVADGTAASPADYAAVNNFSITIAAGAANHTGSFTVTPVDDDLDESNETIGVTGTLSGVTVAAATVTLTDTDDPVSFSIADAEATEGGKITFTVSRGGAEDNVASVKVATAADSGDGVNAAGTDDYTAIATAQTLSFAKGVTSQTVEVQTTQDDLFEPDETFKAVLSDAALAQNDPGTGVSIESGKGTATGTIKNDDTEPSFAVADASASEGDAITFTVTRSGAMDNAVSVKWNTKAANGDGAASASDYTPATTATKLDFAKGVGTQTFTVATTEDTLNEANETFLIELTEPVGATITDAEANGTITNDDAAPTALTLAVDADNDTENVQSSLAENGGAKTVKVTATLGGSTQFDVDKTLTLTVGDDDDSATEGTDYTTVDNITLTIPAGDQDVEHTFTLTPTNDAFREDTETISIDATLTGVTVSGASITLTSDDAAPAITLTVDADKDTDNVQTSLAEDGGVKTVRVTATLDGTTRLEEAADLTLAVGKDGDSAEEGTDYTTVDDQTITIGAGVASVTHDFTLTPTNDNLYEGTETISLDGTLDGVAVTDTSLTLTDDDTRPSFAVADASASEGDDITFTVTRSGAMDNVVSVKWNTKADSSDGANAASATDYTEMSTATKLDFAKGVGTQTFTVATTEDVLHEGDETFLVELTEAVGGIISDTEATGTITDDDAAPSGITLSVDTNGSTSGTPSTVAEDAGATVVTVTATVNGTTRYVDAKTVTVSVGGGSATSDTDYDAVESFDITIAAGDASKAGTFDLTPTDDDLYEGNETIDVTGTSNSLTITKASITLEDNDTQPSFAVADASAVEGDAITFTVTRSGAMDNVVSVKWNTKAATGDGAASASDYTEMSTATKLDFAKDVGSQTFTVATTEDTLNEANETFLIELTEPVGATITDAQATGTITNDDVAPTTLTLVVDADNDTENVQSSLAENGGAKTVKVTATLGGTTQFDVAKTLTLTVGDDDDSATEGTDYTTVDNITLTIPAGDQDVEHTFTLTPTNDAFREGTETISIDATLAGVTVSGTSIMLTSDDAAPAITLTVDADKDTDNVQTSLAEDGGVKTVRVTATLDGTTRLEEAADLTLAVGKDGDSAEEGTDYTTVDDRTITIGAGVASVTHDFTLTPTNDNLYEGAETISLDGTLTGVAVTDTSLTLTDDDTRPSFAVADASASEGDDITFTVTRSGAMDNVVSVKWNTKAANGAGADSTSDYTPATTATKLDFAKGVGTQTFTVATTEDVLHEGDETFLVELTEPVGGTITDAEATGTITDDDTVPSGITLSVDTNGSTSGTPSTVAEDAGATVVTVTATVNGTTRYVDAKTVAVSVADGTAASPADYAAVNNFNITIAAGAANHTGSFTVTPVDDDLDEANETIDVTGTLTDITITGTTVTLTDNDDPVSFSIADAEATEGGKVTFTVSRGGAEDNVAEVKVATAADSGDGVNAAGTDDYTAIATAQTLSFAKGVTSQTVEVQTTQDDLFESDETFKAVLSAPALAQNDPGTGVSIESGKGTATGTIKNDDTQPSFAVANASASEGDAITFTVTRSGAMDNAVSVKWNTKADSSDGANAASVSDYTPATTATKLDFAKGVGTQTFTVATTEDNLHEDDETFLVELTEATGATIATAEATGTITDDDAAPTALTLSVDADTSTVGTQTTIAEDGGAKTVRVTATLGGASTFTEAKTVTLEVGVTADSATEETDYAEVTTRSITINAGTSSGYVDFTLTPTDDTLHEGSETISLDGTLTGLMVTDASITLTDDDGPPSALTLSVDADTGTNNVQTSLAENGGAKTVRVTATLGGSSTFTETKTVTLEVGADTDSANEGTDYTEVSTRSITINAGASSGYVDFTLTPIDDTRHETSETISLDGTLEGVTVTDASLLLTDNDAAPTTLTLAVDADNDTNNVQSSLAENGGAKTVKVTATLGGSTQFDVDKTLTLTVGDDDDSATEGTDYTNVADVTLTIPAGDQDVEHTFTLTPTDDAFREGTETISFDATLAGVTVSGTSIMLTSDDAAPAITLTVDADKDTDNVQTSLAEDGGVKTVRVTATLDGTTRLEEAADLTLAVGKDDDSAEEGTDYATVDDRTITIGAGVASVTHDFTLTPTNDNLYEGAETISLDGTLTGVAVTDTSLTLTDDDTQPSFAVADASASEGDDITFTVTRSGAMDNVVSVKWNTKAATGAGADSTSDYTPATTATKLDFAKGVGTQTFTVATTEDVLHEGDETFLVELTEPVGGTIATAEATGTITDDDAAPSGITLSVDTNGATDGTPSTVAEDAGATVVTVTATVNGTTRYVDAKTVAVSVADGTAASPADYAAVNNFNITIAAGAASQSGSFTVTPVDDDLDEANETIDVTGTLSGVTVAAATVTLTDTDDPVSFSIADAEATEGGKVTFTVSRGGAEDNVASVKVATAADSGDGVNAAGTDDYTAIATAQTLSFAKGVTSQTVEVQTTQDDLFESDETFKAVLSAPALAQNDPGTGVSIESGKGTATGTIKNDDTQPSFAVANASASEGDAITFTVTRSGAMDNAVSVKWNTKADSSDGANAASVSDYTPATTATKLDFAKGVGTQTFTVATTEDNLHEDDETFLVELTEATGATIATAEATGTITDDDAAPTALTLSVDADTSTVGTQTTIAEDGGAKTVRVTATLGGASTFTEAKTVTLEVGVTADSATEETDYAEVTTRSITINAGTSSGYVDFTLTPTDDTLHEGSETISLDGTLTGLMVTDASITLTDDDGPPSALTLSVDADTGTNNVQTSLAENGGAKTVRVTATLGGSSTFTETKTVTLEVGADTDSANEGTDYTEVSTRSITINAGASSGYVDFTLTPIDDTRHETSETISLDGTLEGVTVTDASLLLTDNDAAPTTLTLAVDADNDTNNVQSSLAENGGAKTVKVTATLGGSTQFDVDKTLTLTVGDDDDSATEGTDYTNVADVTLTIPAGDQDVEHTFTLTPTDDAFREGTETISFDATLAGVTVSGTSIMLTSDDAAPAITLTVDADKDTDNVQTSLAEDGGVKTVRVTATLDGTTRLEEAADLTLAVGKDDDSAEEGTDYATVDDRTITIGAGVASVTHDFTLTPTNDNLYEGAETISLDGTLTGVAVTDTSLTLTDDDTQPSFAVADASASEGDDITFTVTRSGAMDNVVSVKWNTKAATGAGADSTSDYTPATTATKLDFAKGVGTQTFTVATTEDVLHEGDETFLVELTEPVGGTIATAEATGTITDDDAAPSGITLSVDTNGATDGTPSTVAEDAGATVVTVTATVNGTTRYVDAKTVAVSVADGTAASPADYAAVNNFNITIAAGAASQSGSFTVTPVDDDLDEANETIDVTGTLSGVTVAAATVTLTDTDDPVSFSIADAEATEGGKVTFTVSRGGAEDNVASVKVATAADSGDGVNAAGTDDYTAIATAQTLSFAKGVTSQTVEVQTTQDDLFESDETFKAVLSAPALAQNDPGTGVSIESGKGTATGTIKNDDTQPSFAVANASASEGDAITFTVTRSGAMDNAVSVKWNTKADSSDGANAASVSDYTPATTATKLDFAKGVGTQTFTVATTEDNLHEDDETFLVELTEATGATIATAEATGTITDDDAAPTALTLSVDADTSTVGTQTTIAEDGGAKTVRVTATLGGASTFTEAKTVTLEVGVTADSATEETDYAEVTTRSITINAGTSSGYVDFTLTPTDDTLHEGSETISLDGTLTGLMVTDASITLTDDDGPPSALTLSVDADTGTNNVQTSLAENGGAKTVRVTATLGGSSTFTETKTVTLEVGADTDSANEGTDYTEVSTRSITINAGASSGYVDFTLTPIDDTRHETSETISLDGTLEGVTVTDASLLLTDNDAAPTTLTLAVDADNDTNNVQSSLAENGGAKTVKVTATLGGSTQFDVDKTLTLTVGDDDDSATEGTDYTNVADVTLTIPAGDQDVEHTFTLTPTDDAFREGTETISFDATLAGVTVSGTSIMLTSDDAAPAITLTVDADKDTDNVQTSLAEDGGVKTVRVTATLDGTTRLEEAADLTLAVGKDDDSAEEGTDYATVADQTITIGAGVVSVTHDFTLTPTNDDLYEGTETISLDGTLDGITVAGTSLTIMDDEVKPTVTLVLTPTSIDESGDGNASTVTATLSGKSNVAVTLTVAAAAGADTVAGDFTLSTTTTLTIAAGATTSTGTVTITAVDNDIDAPNKTVTVSATASGGGVANPTDQTLTITDDEGTPTVTLVLTPTVIDESGATNASTVTATLSGESSTAVTLTVAATAGANTADGDFTLTANKTLTIAAGAKGSTGTVTITAVDNDIDAPNKTVTVSATASGGGVANPTDQTLTITDDEGTPTVTLVLTPTVIDESGATNASTVTATLSGESSTAVTLTVAATAGANTADGDFTLTANKTLTIAAGAKGSTGTVTITAVDNDIDAPNKTVTVSATASGGGVANPTDQTLTITDDDAAPGGITLSVSPTTVGEEDGETEITVTATVNGTTRYVDAKTVTVSVGGGTAISGTDYDAVSNFDITIAAGDASKAGTFDLMPINDVLDEANETINVAGTSGSLTITSTTVTINDDDAAPAAITISVDADTGAVGTQTTIAENGGVKTMRVTATITDATRFVEAKTVTVEVGKSGDSATEGTDYINVGTQSITINAEAASGYVEFSLTPTDDTLHEGSETISLDGMLMGVTVTDATITLTDDDGPPTALTLSVDADTGTMGTQTSLAEDGGMKTVRVTAMLGGGSTFNVAKTVAVEIGAGTDGATEGTDYTNVGTQSITINAGASSGYKDFTVTPTDDDIDEPNEDISIEGTLTGVTVTGTSLTLTDDEGTPSVTLVLMPTTINESGATNSSTVTATLSGESSATVTVEVSVPNTAPVTLSSNTTLTIAAGSKASTGTVTITAVDNDVDAPNASVVVSGKSSGGGITNPGNQTLTITDDEGTPTVTLMLTPNTINERGAMNSSTVAATLSGKSNTAVTLTVAAAAGANTVAGNFTVSTNKTLTIAAGATTSTGAVKITAVNNNVDAPNKSVTVSATASGGGVANPDNQTLTITDDDAAPSGITLSVSPVTVGEGDGLTRITVTATVIGSTRYVDAKTVTVSVGSGTAISGTDYGAVSNFDITIAAANASQTGTFDLTPTDDALHEEDKTIEVTGSSGALTIIPATVTITDNDAAGPVGTVSLSTSRYEVLEGDSLSVTVNLSESPAADTVIELEATSPSGYTATPGADYDGGVHRVTIRAGTTRGKAHISTTRDNQNDPNETFKVAIRASELPGTVTLGEPDTAVVTIREPVSGITPPKTATVVYAGRNSRILMPIPAGLKGHGIDVAFYFDLGGGTAQGGGDCREYETDIVDWGHFPSFPQGTVRTGPVVRIIEDIDTDTIELRVELCEGSVGKTFHATWDTLQYLGNPDRGFPGVKSNPFNAAADHCTSTSLCYTKVTIVGESADHEVTIAGGDVITEGGDAVFTIKASPAPTSDLNVTLALADDAESDFLADGDEGMKTITIAAGSDTATYTLATTDDDLEETNGSVSATLEAGTSYQVGSPSTATVSVTDNDGDDDIPATVVSITGGADITEGGAARFTLTGTPAPSQNITVNLRVTQSGAFAADGELGERTVTLGTDATVTVDFSTVDDSTLEDDGSITVTVEPGTGYTPHSTDASATVAVDDDEEPSLPTIHIDDVEAPEGDDLHFTFTLSHAVDHEVDVWWETRFGPNPNNDENGHGPSYGEAVPHADFRYADSRVTVYPGSTRGEFWVETFDDSHDEGRETLTVVLTDATGAIIADELAVGTIINSDPMPAAWLARFGRTVAEQALDGVTGRIAAPRNAGVQGSIAGHALNFDSQSSGSGDIPRLDPRARTGITGASSTTNDTTTLNSLIDKDMLERSELTLATGDGGTDAFDSNEPKFQSYTMTAREVLLDSSFTATGEKDVSGGSLASWGRSAQSSFDGREGTFSLDGEVTTTMLGVDYARDHWLVGMALMQSNGKGGYRDTETETRAASQVCSTTGNEMEQDTCNGTVRDGDGEVDATLTAVVPYAAIQASERLKLWGTLGHGTGEVTLRPEVGDPLEADISWTMAAVGLRSDILVPQEDSTELGPLSGSGLALAFTADALWARTASDHTNDLIASNSDVTRLRIGLEGSYPIALQKGGSVTPRLEVGVRHDGGTAETGLGLELVGGLTWLDPTLGLSIDLSGRTLIIHSSDDLKNQSFAVEFAWDPDPATRRGPALTFSQQWGTIALGGLDTPFGPDSIEDLGDSGNTAGWLAEASWGFPIFGGSFTGSPHVGVGLGSDTRDYLLGWHLMPAVKANAPDLSFAVKATRQESDTAPPKHGIGFELIFRW